MITTQKTVTIPRLKIHYDEDIESPREWSNLGYFITVDDRSDSPDKNTEMEQIVRDTQSEAESMYEHMNIIKQKIKDEMGERVLYITPVTKYEHSGVSYKRGQLKGYDYSTNGFYIVTVKSAKETGTKRIDFEKVIDGELATYNQWVNGEVYAFTLYGEDGEVEESCGGFYDVESIREHLPSEFDHEDLQDYLK